MSAETDLADLVASCYSDPLRFVQAMYPWGEPGDLASYDGPDAWQADYLTELGQHVKARDFDGHTAVAPIRMALASGHGIGKSTIVAWVFDWIISTRPHSRLTVTANTFAQLETRTWATIQRWKARSLTASWFVIGASRIYQKDHKSSWFGAPQSCGEENSEAFAGQHAADSTSAYLFDEDSNVPDKIHEVAEGGLTDGEPMIFLFGNPTRSTGAFYRAVFGDGRGRWTTRVVDSRTCAFPNQAQIAEWLADYGEDSDFFKVRVRGLPPAAADAQFIDSARVFAAQRRAVVVLPDDPLVAGADLAWGGGDDNVIRFRRGLDARSIPPIRIKGEFTRDPAVLTMRLADVLSQTYDGRKVHTLFLDAAGIAGPIAQRLRARGFQNVIEVNFGAHSPDPKMRFMRDCIWARAKDWLLTGAIDCPKPGDSKDASARQLETDLCGPGVRSDREQRVWLEDKEAMKKRGLDSPDDGDALALTFASPVGPSEAPIAAYRPAGRWG